MTEIILRDGLIYTTISTTHNSKILELSNALVDTGSAATVISMDMASSIGLKPEPTDMINSVQGVGGSETVIEKLIDNISLGNSTIANFKIQLGAMDYGIKLDAIIGLDLLDQCNSIINLKNYTIAT